MSRANDNPISQACAIPYRIAGGRIEVCLVTSRRKQRWIFPKGLIEPGESPIDAALKEAHEEAGVRGRIAGKPLGTYERIKYGTSYRVTCYLLHVDREDRIWRESSIRQRAWVPLEAAAATLQVDAQRDMLAAVVERLQHRGSQAG